MNWLQYRLLLEETWPRDYKYLIKRGPHKIDIEVLDKKTNEPIEAERERNPPLPGPFLKINKKYK